MTSPPTHQLLVRDLHHLDRVAKHLRRDDCVFFGLVCSPSLVPLAIEYLGEKSDKDVPLPVHPAKQDEMLAILSALEAAPSSTVVSVHLSAADVDAWTALNWNREKLLRGGRLLLFMDTLDDLAAFHTHAPDAYSFREAVFAVEGAPAGTPEANADQGEPFDVRTARLLYESKRKPEERAEAAIRWAKALYERGHTHESAKVVQDGLALIPRDKWNDLSHRRIRIKLYEYLALAQYAANQALACFQTCQRGLRDIGTAMVEHMDAFKVHFELHTAESPLGVNREVRLWDVKELPDKISRTNLRTLLIRSEIERGHFRAALGRFNEMLSEDMPTIERAFGITGRARVHRTRGYFRLAKSDLLKTDMLCFRANVNDDWPRSHEVQLLIAEGELDAARNISASHVSGLRLLAVIAAKSGDISGALGHSDAAVTQYLANLQDEAVFHACVDVHSLLRSVPSLSRTDLDRACVMIESAGQKLIDLAEHNPVWYDVLVPGLRAQMLSLYNDRHDEAIASAKQAVPLARSKWPQALARSLRILVECLARANRWNDMLPVLLEGMKAAREEDHLIELATLQAYDLARFARKNDSKDRIDTAREVLGKTFAEMEAPRVEGETWLEVAPYLPLDGGPLDVVPIAEHIYDLFTEMPMPEKASRAMEWMGDAYAARSNAKKADGAYRMALAPLVRHGFGLRTALIQGKLGRLI